MSEKLTKVERRWRWLAHRAWGGTYTGWATDSQFAGKGDKAILERRIKAGHVKVDDGLIRLTDIGREAMGISP